MRAERLGTQKSVRPVGAQWMMAEKKRRILLNVLHDAQERHGYLSEEALKKISVEENIPVSRAYAVASFYSMLRTRPQGRNTIDLCGSPSCVLNGGGAIERCLKKELGIKTGETTPDGQVSLYKTSCIGCCDGSPAMLLNGMPCTKLTKTGIRKMIRELRTKKGGKGCARPQKKKRKR